MFITPNINTNYDCLASLQNNDSHSGQLIFEKILHDENLPHDHFVNIASFKRNEKFFETTYVLKNEELNSKWIALYDLFNSSYKSKQNLFSDTSFDTIDTSFRSSMNNILKLEPKVATVGVSEEGCVYIYAEFKQKRVFFNMFYEGEQSDVVLNITEDGRPICSYNANIESSINTLKDIIGRTVQEVDNYDLSRTFITAV